MKIRLFTALASLALAGLAAAQSPQFTKPDRVRYDGQCFTINGKDTVVYSGAFHYFRCPEALWPKRFQMIKDAGFNTVETYVAWNYHEQTPPKGLNDFSHVDLGELDRWLKMAIDKYGFNVIARPGPYICAEWLTGGFPNWLMRYLPADKKNKNWLRTADPVFLQWSKHWFDAVCPVIAKYQITRQPAGKPGVILFQIENEYDYFPDSDENKTKHLHSLAQFAIDKGIDVPLFGCWTRQIRGSQDPLLKQAMDACNFYPRWGIDGIADSLADTRAKQPNAPLMISETQGGWFSEVGGLLAEDQDGITAAQENNLILYALQNGVTAINYYMLFGGSNFADWSPGNITQSYDYFAPIRETGVGGPKYRVVKALGEFLKKYGPQLARSTLVADAATSDNKQVEVAVRQSPDGTRFVFIRNHDRRAANKATISLGRQQSIYSLEPFGAEVAVVSPSGQMELHPMLEGPPGVDAALDVMQTIREVEVRADIGGSKWQSVKPNTSLLDLGIYDPRTVIYRSKFDASPKQKFLRLGLIGNSNVLVELNGQFLTSSGRRGEFVLGNAVRPKDNHLQILLESPGQANGGMGMQEVHGVASIRLAEEPKGDGPLSRWKFRHASQTDGLAEIAADYDDTRWREVTAGGDGQAEMNSNGAIGVFRTTLDMSKEFLASKQTVLKIESVDDDGWIYVNGQKAGESHNWNTPLELDIRKWLKVGKNVIAIVVKNNTGPGGLAGAVELSVPTTGASLPIEVSPRLAGDAAEWWNDASSLGWAKVQLMAPGAAPNTLPNKVRTPFHLSEPPSGPMQIWTRFSFKLGPRFGDKPQTLRLNALGNGRIYLNGHALGRYWQIGPQREFYLPECWLHYDGTPNRIVISLRPVEGAAQVKGAQIIPVERQ